MVDRIDYSAVVDAPLDVGNGASMTRVVVFDVQGNEVDWLSIDVGIPDLAPTAEHPDREYLGFPEGIDRPASFYNNVDEGWAVPSLEAGIDAALYEHAFRVYDRWYREDRP